MIAKFFCAVAAFLFASPALADWHEAASDHFVVYADASPAQLSRFAERLERYHAALALVTGQANTVPSPSNRVTVYAVGNKGEVRQLFGDAKSARYVGGFYIPRAGQTIAIVPDISSASDSGDDQALKILLHEYTHHFLITTSSFPIPRWANEGAAEFYSSARFGKDGQVSVGQPDARRLTELKLLPTMAVDQLIDPDTRSLGENTFYAQSWLLYHYLMLGGPRKGQLTRYYNKLVGGANTVDAAKQVFGDLRLLGKELDLYARSPKFTTVVIAGKVLPTGAVAVRPLAAGEAASIGLRIRQQRGLPPAERVAARDEARGLAARFPADAVVQAILSRAEFDLGNDQAAIAAADAALKLDSRLVPARVQKGLAEFRVASTSKLPDDFKRARDTFVDLNLLENDHPLPLVYYYRSFVAQNQQPSAVAVQGLVRATELAPFDLTLRLNLAGQLLRDGRRAEARYHLVPVAYAPHGGLRGVVARQLLAKLDSDPQWRGEGAPLVTGDSSSDGGAIALPAR